jgi:nucleoside-diphosphate-sugar epimerase
MSSPPRSVRSRRTAPVVGVVGAGSGPAHRILEVLSSPRVQSGGSASRNLVGLDVAPEGAPASAAATAPDDTPSTAAPNVSWRPLDLSQPASLLAALRGLDAVVYVAASTDLVADLVLHPRERRDLAVRRIQALVIATAAAAVSQLVVVSSAMVYGAALDNAVPLPEDADLAAERNDGLVGDLLAVEEVLETARDVHLGLAVTVLRPAALVGAGADTVITRHFEAPRLLTLKTGCPAWQFCHVDDLATAVDVVIRQRLGPVLTVASGPAMTQPEVEHLSGMRHVELSESLAFGTATRLHRAGVLPMPASDLTFAVYPWVVSSATLRAAGWSAAYDAPTCLGVLLEGTRGRHAVASRRVDRKDAALGAALGAASASATVALVGTAAVLRRRRRKGS